jgi:microtubule-associated serine/threonine kinase
MEEKLKKFIEQNKLEEVDCDAITRFLHHQTMELARDCLQKSQDKQITGTYFFELSEKLEKLLIDVSDTPQDRFNVTDSGVVMDYTRVILLV